ncbi:hypothetical protein [Olivibacter ginsenosidimutans]|uniref:hypothetical protein n=1 Tax=Olivibacter ginsenosidimutans TaxID=1176537 RepID=UPI0031E6CF89
MRNLRITPLNIVCAVWLAWLFGQVLLSSLEWKVGLMSFLLVMVMVVADQFFRFFFRTMKRVWLTEIGFVAFTLLIIWVIGLM